MDTTNTYARPVPAPDEVTAEFWQAVARHELFFQRCDHCGQFAHPPVAFCGNCHRLDQPSFAFAEVSGRGRIINWTVIHDQMVSGFAGSEPIVHVLVALDEPDLRYTATLVGDRTGLALDAPVRTVFHEVAPGVTLPYFELVAVTDAAS